MPTSTIQSAKSEPSTTVRSSLARRVRMVGQLLFVRLRFFLILAFAFAVVINWDNLRTYWARATQPLKSSSSRGQLESPDIEYWCPMCPGVLSDHSMKCPVCNMGLVARRRGEMVAAADGSLARMQLSPYRIQLAGIQTAAVAYRPLAYEIITGGVIATPTDEPTASRGRVWLTADVYEKDLALLRAGRRAEIVCDRIPSRSAFPAHVAKLVSSQRGSPQILLEIEDPDRQLPPGVYASALIKIPVAELQWHRNSQDDESRDRATLDAVRRALADPWGSTTALGLESALRLATRRILRERGLILSVLDSAVIDTGVRKVVYREMAPGMFEAVEVVVGPRAGEYRPVLRGLEPGQRVAAAGAFLLDAETRLNPAVAAAYFGAARPPAPSRAPKPGTAQALAALPAADRALALRQKNCPVTGEPLGSMGTPVRLDIAGKSVFLCCEGCESEFKANEKKYLSKVASE